MSNIAVIPLQANVNVQVRKNLASTTRTIAGDYEFPCTDFWDMSDNPLLGNINYEIADIATYNELFLGKVMYINKSLDTSASVGDIVLFAPLGVSFYPSNAVSLTIGDLPEILILTFANDYISVITSADGGGIVVDVLDSPVAGIGLKNTVDSTASTIYLKNLTSNNNSISFIDGADQIDLSARSINDDAIPTTYGEMDSGNFNVNLDGDLNIIGGGGGSMQVQDSYSIQSATGSIQVVPNQDFIITTLAGNIDANCVDASFDVIGNFEVDLSNPGSEFRVLNLPTVAATGNLLQIDNGTGSISYTPVVAAVSDYQVIGGFYASVTVPGATTQDVHLITIPANTFTTLGQSFVYFQRGSISMDNVGSTVEFNPVVNGADVTAGGGPLFTALATSITPYILTFRANLTNPASATNFNFLGHIEVTYINNAVAGTQYYMANSTFAFDPTVDNDVEIRIATSANTTCSAVHSKLTFIVE